MSKFATGTRILTIALLAVPLLQSLAGADDDFQQPTRPAVRQNRRPQQYRRSQQNQASQQNRVSMMPGSTTPNHEQNAVFNRAMANSAEPNATQREMADPASDPSDDTVANWERADGPESPLPDGNFVPSGAQYQPNGTYGGLWSRNQCGQCGGPAGCCRCCPCGLPGRFWVRDEYLGFWTGALRCRCWHRPVPPVRCRPTRP